MFPFPPTRAPFHISLLSPTTYVFPKDFSCVFLGPFVFGFCIYSRMCWCSVGPRRFFIRFPIAPPTVLMAPVSYKGRGYSLCPFIHDISILPFCLWPGVSYFFPDFSYLVRTTFLTLFLPPNTPGFFFPVFLYPTPFFPFFFMVSFFFPAYLFVVRGPSFPFF